MNELNGQISIDEIAMQPKRLISLADQASISPNPWRYKELVMVVDIISKIVYYTAYRDGEAICNTDNLIEAMATYNTIK